MNSLEEIETDRPLNLYREKEKQKDVNSLEEIETCHVKSGRVGSRPVAERCEFSGRD